MSRTFLLFSLCILGALLLVVSPLTVYAQAGLDALAGQTLDITPPPPSTNDDCGTFDIVCWISTGFLKVAQGAANSLIGLFSYILFAGAWLLELSIYINVQTLSEIINGIPAIDIAWRASRDVANLFFIWILIYVGIATMLQIRGVDTRRTIVWVIIIALVVNFSAVFTKVVIDISNVLAYRFYELVATNQAAPAAGAPNEQIGAGIAWEFMRAMQLSSWSNPEGLGASTAEGGILEGGSLGFGGIVTNLIMSIIVILVLTWSFFVIAVLFFIRTGMLILLVALSPLAFLAAAMPKREGLWNQWFKTLIDQAFFAPAYLFMLLLVITILRDPNFERIGTTANQGVMGTSAGGAVAVLVSYMIVLVFIISSLIMAKKMSRTGAEKAVDAANKYILNPALGGARSLGGSLAGAAGRNTIGRFGKYAAERGWVKEGAAGGGNLAQRVAGITLRGLGKKTAGASFGGAAKGYEGQIERQVERAQEYAKTPEQRAKVLVNLGGAAQREYFKKMSERERVDLIEEGERREKRGEKLYGRPSASRLWLGGRSELGTILKNYQGTLSSEEKDKLQETRKKASDARRDRELRGILDGIKETKTVPTIDPATSKFARDKDDAIVPEEVSANPIIRERQLSEALSRVVKDLRIDEGRRLRDLLEKNPVPGTPTPGVVTNDTTRIVLKDIDPQVFEDLVTKGKLSGTARKRVIDDLNAHKTDPLYAFAKGNPAIQNLLRL